jgi:hypothetical protein
MTLKPDQNPDQHGSSLVWLAGSGSTTLVYTIRFASSHPISPLSAKQKSIHLPTEKTDCVRYKSWFIHLNTLLGMVRCSAEWYCTIQYGTIPVRYITGTGLYRYGIVPVRIRIFSIPDKKIPDPGSASQNLGIFTQKIDSKLSEIWSGMFIPDPDLDFLPIPDPGSRGQKGTGSRIRIRNTALQFIDKRNYQICTVQVPLCRAVVFTQFNFAFCLSDWGKKFNQCIFLQ